MLQQMKLLSHQVGFHLPRFRSLMAFKRLSLLTSQECFVTQTRDFPGSSANNSPRFADSHHFSFSNNVGKSHPLPGSDLNRESAELNNNGLFRSISIIDIPSFGFSKCFGHSDELIKSNRLPHSVFSFPISEFAASSSFEGTRLDSSRDNSPSEQLVQSNMLDDSASPPDFPAGELHESSSFESAAMIFLTAMLSVKHSSILPMVFVRLLSQSPHVFQMRHHVLV
jgi:hypothetical protein